MYEHRAAAGYRYRTYQVDADGFDLHEGDIVEPGLEIGTDVHSKAPVLTDYWGYVATVYYNTMNDSFLVMVCLQRSHKGIPQSENRILCNFSLILN